jgi:hypothetical protein
MSCEDRLRHAQVTGCVINEASLRFDLSNDLVERTRGVWASELRDSSANRRDNRVG